MTKGIVMGIILVAAAAVAQDKGAEIYAKHCQKCHAEDGSGMKDGAPVKVAKTLKLKDPAVLSLLRDEAVKLADADMEKTILEGKEKMKGLKDKMSADEVKEVMAHVRALQAKKK